MRLLAPHRAGSSHSHLPGIKPRSSATRAQPGQPSQQVSGPAQAGEGRWGGGFPVPRGPPPPPLPRSALPRLAGTLPPPGRVPAARRIPGRLPRPDAEGGERSPEANADRGSLPPLTPLPAAPQDPPEQRDCRPRRSSMGQCNCRKKRKVCGRRRRWEGWELWGVVGGTLLSPLLGAWGALGSVTPLPPTPRDAFGFGVPSPGMSLDLEIFPRFGQAVLGKFGGLELRAASPRMAEWPPRPSAVSTCPPASLGGALGALHLRRPRWGVGAPEMTVFSLMAPLPDVVSGCFEGKPQRPVNHPRFPSNAAPAN